MIYVKTFFVRNTTFRLILKKNFGVHLWAAQEIITYNMKFIVRQMLVFLGMNISASLPRSDYCSPHINWEKSKANKFGFDLSSMLKVWKTEKNVAYLAFFLKCSTKTKSLQICMWIKLMTSKITSFGQIHLKIKSQHTKVTSLCQMKIKYPKCKKHCIPVIKHGEGWVIIRVCVLAINLGHQGPVKCTL